MVSLDGGFSNIDLLGFTDKGEAGSGFCLRRKFHLLAAILLANMKAWLARLCCHHDHTQQKPAARFAKRHGS